MKKIIIAIAATILVFSMSASAFATSDTISSCPNSLQSFEIVSQSEQNCSFGSGLSFLKSILSNLKNIQSIKKSDESAEKSDVQKSVLQQNSADKVTDADSLSEKSTGDSKSVTSAKSKNNAQISKSQSICESLTKFLKSYDCSLINNNSKPGKQTGDQTDKPSVPPKGDTKTQLPDDAKPKTPAPSDNAGKKEPADNTASLSYEEQVAELVNKHRAENGLKPLTLNQKLSDVARAKSQDMHDKSYFSHTSPTYGSPFDMMKTFGISFRAAGENIAKGQRTPQQVVDDWMNSPGHRANILNSSYTQIGVGYVADGNYWTQLFTD